MKNVLFGAASLLAMAAPSLALAQNGYVGLDYYNTDVDGFGSDDAWGASGAAELTRNFAIDGGILSNDDDTSVGATGHLYWNNSQHLFGGFLSVADAEDSTLWSAGAEGQLYAGPATFAGAISYGRDDDADVDATGVNGEARYFFADNVRIEGGLGWFNVDTPLGDDNVLSFGAGGEYQFAAAPISVGLAYTHATLDEADVDADTFAATVRWNFGGSLRERDRTGAALAGLSGVGSALGL